MELYMPLVTGAANKESIWNINELHPDKIMCIKKHLLTEAELSRDLKEVLPLEAVSVEKKSGGDTYAKIMKTLAAAANVERCTNKYGGLNICKIDS